MIRPLAALVFAVALLAAPGVPAASAEPRASVASRVENAIRKKRHTSVRFSLAVWDAATGERLASSSPDTLRRTASVMKLVTTAGALEILGPEHELSTEIRATAAPSGGVVAGDLVVEGQGDPGFSTHAADDGVAAEMRRFASQVRAAGVTRVDGDLVVDTSAFPEPARHPGWGHEPGNFDWYTAPVTAVTLADACLDVSVYPGAKPGDAGRVELAPPNGVVEFVNRLGTTSSKSKHVIRFGPDGASGGVVASGSVWTGSTGYTASIACVDPPVLFGDVLGRSLAAEGVQITGSVRVVRGPPVAPWPRVESRPGVVVARHVTRLADAVDVTNRRSQNLWAELILRHVGLVAGDGGTPEDGARVVAAALGLEADALQQADGSGLARENVATVGAIGHVLLHAFASPYRLQFMGSLARGGDPDGTLRKRFREKGLEGRVLGKTGTLRDTSALAGYVLADEGRVLAYAILCEGDRWRGRALQDAVVSALLDG